MSRTASQLAERLRSALHLQAHRPRHARHEKVAPSRESRYRSEHEPDAGEEFARRLREALEV